MSWSTHGHYRADPVVRRRMPPEVQWYVSLGLPVCRLHETWPRSSKRRRGAPRPRVSTRDDTGSHSWTSLHTRMGRIHHVGKGQRSNVCNWFGGLS
ncbi:hypothetical protein CsatB_024527 [Cannabis sativa]